MEKVTVKLVVFKHPEPEKWPVYCSYCPAIKEYQGRSNTIKNVVKTVEKILEIYLSQRFSYKKLQKFGWIIERNSIIPPTFTDEDAVKLTENYYGLHLTDYQIIELYAKIPLGMHR